MEKPSDKLHKFDDNQAANEDFFTGATNTVNMLDPLLTGFAFIKWVATPGWLTKVYPGFEKLTEKNLRAIDLPGDIELTTTGITSGFTNNETHVVNGVTKNQGFTITHREWSGSPIRNAYSYWAGNVRDPETGIALYPKKHGVPYATKNHTGELLYIVTRPDANNFGREGGESPIEFACYFTNVMPTRIPLAHLNYQAGSSEPQEIQISFTGNMFISPKVDEFAATVFQGGAQSLYNFKPEGEFTSTQFGS